MNLNKSNADWLTFLQEEMPGNWYKASLYELVLVSGKMYILFSITTQKYRMYDNVINSTGNADLCDAKRFYKKHFKLKNFL